MLIILLDDKLSQAKKENEGGMINADFLISQIKQLENHIVQLQPMLADLESGQSALSARKKLLQSMALVQALLIYINEMASLI